MTPDPRDAYFRHVFGEAYRALPQGTDLTAIEQAALEPLRRAWATLPPEESWFDREWGVTTDRRDPEAWRLLPLTLAHLDAFAARVWIDPRDHDGAWSVKP